MDQEIGKPVDQEAGAAQSPRISTESLSNPHESHVSRLIVPLSPPQAVGGISRLTSSRFSFLAALRIMDAALF